MSAPPPDPALVILAAGASSRLGECKATVLLGGRSALEHLCAAGALLAGSPTLVVAGAHAARIRAALPPGVELLVNEAWERGRTGGLLLARAARPGRDLCVAPIDAPLVPAEVFRALAEAWRAAGSPARGWLAPRHRASGRFGHPLILGRELLGRLREAEPDRPLHELRALAEPLLGIEVESEAILDDLDTPLDLEGLRRRLAAGTPPFPARADPIGGRCNPGEAAPSPSDGGR